MAQEDQQLSGALPPVAGEGETKSTDVGFAVGQAVSAALLGGLSIGAQRDFVSPFLQNQQRLEGIRAQKQERRAAARFLAAKPGMDKVFTEFGSGNLDVGVDRFSELDTEVGLRILEDGQKTKQFDAMVDAFAEQYSEDPGMQQGLQDLKGQGFTDLGAINGLIQSREAKRAALVTKESLELKRNEAFWQTSVNLMNTSGARWSKIGPVVMETYFGANKSPLETPTAQGDLKSKSGMIELLNANNLREEASQGALESFEKVGTTLKNDPEIADHLMQAMQPRFNQMDRDVLTTLTLFSGPDVSEVEQQFLASQSEEARAAYNNWKAAGQPVNAAQMMRSGHGALLDNLQHSFAGMNPKRFTDAQVEVEENTQKAARVDNVQGRLVALQDEGLFGPDEVSAVIAALDVEQISFDQQGRLVLNTEATAELSTSLSNPADSLDDVLGKTILIGSEFSPQVTNTYLRKNKHILEKQLGSTELEETLERLSKNPSSFAATGVNKVVQELEGEVSAALTFDETGTTPVYQVKFGDLQAFGRNVGPALERLVEDFPAQFGDINLGSFRELTQQIRKETGGEGGIGTAQSYAAIRIAREIRKKAFSFEHRNAMKATAGREDTSGLFEQNTSTRVRELLTFLESDFAQTIGNMSEAEFESWLASDPSSKPFFGPVTFSVDGLKNGGVSSLAGEEGQEPSMSFDVAKFDAKAAADSLWGLGSKLWIETMPGAPQQQVFDGFLAQQAEEARKQSAVLQAQFPTLKNQGSIGSMLADRATARVIMLDNAVKKSSQYALSNNIIRTGLQTYTPASLFGKSEEIFLAGEDELSNPILDVRAPMQLWESTKIEDKVSALSLYMSTRVKHTTELDTSMQARTLEVLETQRGVLKEQAVQLENALIDVDEDGLRAVLVEGFGFKPQDLQGIDADTLRTNLVLMSLFRAPV